MAEFISFRSLSCPEQRLRNIKKIALILFNPLNSRGKAKGDEKNGDQRVASPSPQGQWIYCTDPDQKSIKSLT